MGGWTVFWPSPRLEPFSDIEILTYQQLASMGCIRIFISAARRGRMVTISGE